MVYVFRGIRNDELQEKHSISVSFCFVGLSWMVVSFGYTGFCRPFEFLEQLDPSVAVLVRFLLL